MYALFADDDFADAKVGPLRDVLRSLFKWQVETAVSADEVRQKLANCVVPPDLVILDITFNDEDKELLRQFSASPADNDIAKRITGLVLCAEIRDMYPELCVVLLSEHLNPKLIALGYTIGARMCLIKHMEVQFLATCLDALRVEMYPHQRGLYHALSGLFTPGSLPFGDDTAMLSRACQRFFSSGDPWVRYNQLCASLSPLLVRVLGGDNILNEVRQYMTRTHQLIGAADSGVRDHAVHSGNVLWLGLWILGCVGNNPLFAGKGLPTASTMPPVQQMRYVWLLSGLFHDMGYMFEKASALDKVIKQLCKGKTASSGIGKTFSSEAKNSLSMLKTVCVWMSNNNMREEMHLLEAGYLQRNASVGQGLCGLG